MVLFSLSFVRHGETLYNRKNIIQGHTDIPLSSLGERQAQLAAIRLQNERFTHVFASDLSRAHQTAKIIADANKVCRCEIILDKRIRERKFGAAEGKSSKDLILSAKRAKKKYIEYTPPGAESILQVQDRVESFFKDVCRLCVDYSKVEDVSYLPSKIKRTHGGSLGRNSGPNKRLELSRRSQSFCGSGNLKNILNDMSLTQDMLDDSDDEFDAFDVNDNNVGYFHSGSFLSLQDSDNSDVSEKALNDYRYRECFPSSSDDSNFSSDLKSCSGSSSSLSECPSTDMADIKESALACEANEIESDSTLSHVSSTHSCEIQTDPVVSGDSPVNSHSNSVLQDINSPSPGCPNVSLTPSDPNNRLASMSSISSGRNNSFDELDGLPTNVADILVVSHGGYIKEMMRYFVEKLDCKIPGMKGHAFKVCPNCSISKFTISLDERTGQPSLTCITIHDKDHLVGLEEPEAKGAY